MRLPSEPKKCVLRRKSKPTNNSISWPKSRNRRLRYIRSSSTGSSMRHVSPMRNDISITRRHHLKSSSLTERDLCSRSKKNRRPLDNASLFKTQSKNKPGKSTTMNSIRRSWSERRRSRGIRGSWSLRKLKSSRNSNATISRYKSVKHNVSKLSNSRESSICA